MFPPLWKKNENIHPHKNAHRADCSARVLVHSLLLISTFFQAFLEPWAFTGSLSDYLSDFWNLLPLFTPIYWVLRTRCHFFDINPVGLMGSSFVATSRVQHHHPHPPQNTSFSLVIHQPSFLDFWMQPFQGSFLVFLLIAFFPISSHPHHERHCQVDPGHHNLCV